MSKYKCPECKKTLTREGKRNTVNSYCSSTGKEVVLKKVARRKK